MQSRTQSPLGFWSAGTRREPGTKLKSGGESSVSFSGKVTCNLEDLGRFCNSRRRSTLFPGFGGQFAMAFGNRY